jgi:hypothetical protein
VATEWSEYGQLDWVALAGAMHGTLVYDTRAIVDVEAAQAAGLQVERLGRRRPLADQPGVVALRVPEPATSSARES